MPSIGIIAEYNPFHNGHLYHIKKIKEKYPDAPIILVMSGNFTQRGDIAIIDKFKRCEIALKSGIDLIIELPFPFSTSSADYFAYGALKILDTLKVDRIIFGSESDDINNLDIIAKTQIDNPLVNNLVGLYSKQGYNYPTSLSKAIKDVSGVEIKTPNDLLGVSYLKQIKLNRFNIEAETIKRTSDYHSNSLDKDIVSASAIREALKDNKDISKQVPDYTLEYYNDLHFIDDYFKILKYKIITSKDLSIYQDVDEGIENKLKRVISECNSTFDLINKIKTKRYTYNKITRMLIHILCNYTKELNKEFNDIKYIRILGLNNKGQKYLNSIKKDIELPIISKINREKDPMLEYELETTKIYSLIGNNNLITQEFDKIIKDL